MEYNCLKPEGKAQVDIFKYHNSNFMGKILRIWPIAGQLLLL